MTFEAHVFIDMVNRDRAVASNTETFDSAVGRFMDAAEYCTRSGCDISDILRVDRNAAAGCGLYEMDAYDAAISSCSAAAERIPIDMYVGLARDLYSGSNRLGKTTSKFLIFRAHE